MTRSFIITAGGIGTRMQANQPKQFIEVAGLPILMHTIRRLHSFDTDAQLLITLPEAHVSTWKSLVDQYEFNIPHGLVIGGEERFHSIQNALMHCTGSVIAVHDGVRPLVSHETLTRLFDAAETHEAVIPVVSVKESLRILVNNESKAVERSVYKVVQTPQVFHTKILIEAYKQPFTTFITDDASLVEQLGHPIFLVDGNEENIKLTTPADLGLAERLLKM